MIQLKTRQRQRTWAQGMAAVGVVFLVWQGWTYMAWLADGPSQITQFRDHDWASWIVARVFEAAAVIGGLGMVVWLAQQCRREGGLSLDTKLTIAGGVCVFWLDPMVNFYQPLFMYSSNWVNLEQWCGHMPFVVNADCGRMPEPVLFVGTAYAVGFVAFAMFVNAIMRGVRRRRPSASAAFMVASAFFGAVLLDVLFESFFVAMHLWSYPGSPAWTSVLGRTHRFPLSELIVVGIYIGGFASIRSSATTGA